MTTEREKQILKYTNTLEIQSQNPGFLAFLHCLTTDEKETYFYIDTHRMNEFIKGFSHDKTNQVGIADLKDPLAFGNFKQSIIKSEEALKSLIDFWGTFGNLQPPGIAIRMSVINKHNIYIRELTEEEKDFFLNC